MAKHCEVCDQSYLDELAACPHCAARAESAVDVRKSALLVELAGKCSNPDLPFGSESEINLNQPRSPAGPRPGSGSAIDLGRGRPTHSAPPPGSESQIDISLPPPRVPDTNSGVILHHADADMGNSGVAWSAGDSRATDASGLRIDSPSDADLLANIAANSGSASEVALPDALKARSASDASGVRVLPGSHPDLGPSAAADESSGINLGGSRPIPPPASDSKLSSKPRGSAAGDSGVDSLVRLPNAPAAPSETPAGAASSSSILPERRSVAPPADAQPRRKAPTTQIALGEHFSSADDSAVNLGGLPERPADDEPVPASQEAAESSANAIHVPHLVADHSGRSGRIGSAPLSPRSKMLRGAVLGLVVGAGITACLMTVLGGDSGRAKAQAPANSNPGASAAVEQSGKEWAARFGDKGPDAIASQIERLERERQVALKTAADQAEAAKAAESKSVRLTADTKEAQKQITAQTRRANAADKIATDLTAAVEKARQAEAAAREQAEAAAKTQRAATAETAQARQIARAAEAKRRAAEERESAAAKQIEEISASRRKAEALLEVAAKKLKDAKYLKADAAAIDVSHAVDQVIAAAKTSDPTGKLAKVRAELAAALAKQARLEEQLAQRAAVSSSSSEPGDGDPLRAEAVYIAGVQQFWEGAYARAEQQFLAAIHHDSGDARYHYYLGLSRWSQGKRAAAEREFQCAADLEQQDRPGRAAVNAALERIQGGLRREVDQFRK